MGERRDLKKCSKARSARWKILIGNGFGSRKYRSGFERQIAGTFVLGDNFSKSLLFCFGHFPNGGSAQTAIMAENPDRPDWNQLFVALVFSLFFNFSNPFQEFAIHGPDSNRLTGKGQENCKKAVEVVYYGLMSQVECACLERVEQLARERGLLESGQKLNCPYQEACDGSKCLFERDRQNRTIYLAQSGKDEPVNADRRFRARAEKSLAKLRELRYH